MSAKRAGRYAAQRTAYEEWLRDLEKSGTTDVDWSRHDRACERMGRLGMATLGLPTFVGNEMTLLTDTEEILRAIIADLEKAQTSIHMAFYIWHRGGTADEVVEALVRARKRNVTCRVLVDDLGSEKWLRGKGAKRLREAGVQLVRALQVGLLRGFVERNDLRLHRKIVIVDGKLGYTGSMNLVDPRFFKQQSGVGQWIDAMVRMEGPAVEALRATFLSDWQRETGEPIDEMRTTCDLHPLEPVGNADVQVVPSGPGEGTMKDGILQMLMKMMYAACREIVITTPYFVPDESMLRALRTAAAHGVEVHLIVPAKVDSVLVRYASRSYFDDLMEAGVNIQQFKGGLLHTKSITVDGRISMFGTLNLDMRSLWLNYEISLFVYDRGCGEALRALQQTYLDDCTLLEREPWEARPFRARFIENSTRLVSPLL